MKDRITRGILWLLVPGFLISGLVVPTSAQERQPELKKLKVLLVIDAHAPNLEKIVQIDKESMLAIMREGIPPDRLQVDILEGPDATPEKIYRYYGDLETGPEDGLVFFYVGHGGMVEKEHYMTIVGDDKSPDTYGGNRRYRLNREFVVTTMWMKKPGLAVVLTACCSSFMMPGEDRMGMAPPPTEVATQLNPVMRSLFFEHRGIVDITAAPPGEVALGNNLIGTIFVSSLARLLRGGDPKDYGSTDGFVSWKSFHSRLKEEMNRITTKMKAEDEEARRSGKLVPLDPNLDVQLAYDFQLADEGKVWRPKWFLGILFLLEQEYGVGVQQVFPDSPASRAGLKEGDQLLSLNGQQVFTDYQVKQVLFESQGKLELKYRRKGSREVQTVTVDLQPAK